MLIQLASAANLSQFGIRESQLLVKTYFEISHKMMGQNFLLSQNLVCESPQALPKTASMAITQK
jgi:hypothetical protein